MNQSLTQSAGITFPFSSSIAGFKSHHRVTFLRQSNRITPVYAAAIAEAPPVMQRRKPASFYDVLRVKENASAKEIKAAYRNLAKVYHPDVGSRPEESSDGRNFIEIHEAYATLSDPISRDLYDLKLNMSSRRRGDDGIRINGSEFYPTRRWETDQCW